MAHLPCESRLLSAITAFQGTPPPAAQGIPRLRGTPSPGYAGYSPDCAVRLSTSLDRPELTEGQTVRLTVTGVPAWQPLECRAGGALVPVDELADGTRRVLVPIAGDASGNVPIELSTMGPKGWTWKTSARSSDFGTGIRLT